MMSISFKENEKENIIALHLQTLSKKNRLLSQFVSKLRFLLHNPKYYHWSPDGEVIIITDVSSFKDNILQKEGEMFKTQNFSSFVRQLNLYRFRKISGIGKCDTFKNMKFEHLYFRKERPDIMHLVQRTCLPSRHKKAENISFISTQSAVLVEVIPTRKLTYCQKRKMTIVSPMYQVIEFYVQKRKDLLKIKLK